MSEATGAEPPKRRRAWAARLSSMRGRAAGVLRRPPPEPEPEPELPPPPAEEPMEYRLLRRSPFGFGFMGALGVLVAITLVSMLGQIQSVVVLAVLSLFLALGLSPIVEWLTAHHLPRWLAVLLVVATGLGLIGGGVVALVPILNQQIATLGDNLPHMLDNLRDHPTVADLDERFGILDRLAEFTNSDNLMSTLLARVFGGLWGAGQILANLVFSIVLTMVLTIYFLATLPSIRTAIHRLAPASRRERSRYLVDEIMGNVGGFLNGMLIVVCVAGGCAFVFLNFVGLGGYSIALSFITAIFCFIPMVGSWIAMLVVALVGFGVSPSTGIAVIVYFLCYMQFDAYVVYPHVMRRTVRIPGALVVLSAIAGAILFGVLGALVAIPVAAILVLVYRRVLLPYLDSH